MINLSQVLVVEGTYDKTRLAGLVNTLIIPTNGFAIFKDQEKIQLLRTLCRQRGVVILTDSDSAGFLIRNRLKQLLSQGEVYHAYIPDVYGKEKRKSAPSAEGKLGVEGMTTQVLEKALADAGVGFCHKPPETGSITKADFMAWGLSGTPLATTRRKALQRHLKLPENMSANTLLEVLCRLYSCEEIATLVERLFSA